MFRDWLRLVIEDLLWHRTARITNERSGSPPAQLIYEPLGEPLIIGDWE